MAAQDIQLQIISDAVLEKEEELPKPKFSLDPLMQAANYELTRKHFQLLQLLDTFCLALGVLLLFVPLWFTYENVGMGLDRVYLKDWVGMRSVKMPDCLVNASSLVCYSLERFYVAGVIVSPRQFKILWIFLHLLAPVLWVFSFVLWYVVAEVFVRSNFIYEFGCLGAMGLGLGQCGLAIYYYHYKLVEDEGNAPSYLALPS